MGESGCDPNENAERAISIEVGEGRSDAAKEGPMGVKEYEQPRALSFLSS